MHCYFVGPVVLPRSKGFEGGAAPSPMQEEGLVILNVLLLVCNFKDCVLQQFSTAVNMIKTQSNAQDRIVYGWQRHSVCLCSFTLVSMCKSGIPITDVGKS